MKMFDPSELPDPSDTAAVDAYCRMRRTVRGLRHTLAMLAAIEGVWHPCRTGTGMTMWRNERRFTIRPVDGLFTLTEKAPDTSVTLGVFRTLAEAKAAADHAAASGG